MKTWLLALTLIALSLPATAAAPKLGRPSYGGPGCPAGTATVVAGNDSISIRFDRYQVAAGGASGKGFDRKACSLSIPVKVPAGKSVAVIAVTFTGYNRLPAGATSQFRVEQFLAGGSGPVFSRNFKGPQTGRFSVSNDAALVWSACGGGVTLRTNSSLLVRSSGGQAASASIRSQEVKTAIVYRLRWKDC